MTVTEQDAFLSLFPHRWDWIFAEHVAADRPNWQTESRFPLSDRQILSGEKLYGVRFGTETSYFMLDIDSGSAYHPKRDRFAVRRICNALEILGFTSHVAITSSYSSGVHLYFPLQDDMLTWQLAAVVTHRLQTAGFVLEPGTLEVFPNNRTYSDAGQLSLFNAHRLPMQQGSYLLSEDWELQWSDRAAFVSRWVWAANRNSVNRLVYDRLLLAAVEKNRARRLSRPANKFLLDLQNDISPGWTGHGQTNFMLGRITLLSYCFGHYLQGLKKPLTGERLVLEIVKVATQSPGYKDWCRHQHEIYRRAEEWASCVERSRRYFPYGYKELRGEPEQPPLQKRTQPNTWNQRQMADARDRLTFAIAVLLNNDRLPSGARERFDILTQDFHFSGETLYHHRDLWHPAFLWKTPPNPPNKKDVLARDCAGGAPAPKTAGNLLDQTGRNQRPALDWGAFLTLLEGEAGCNTSPGKDLSDLEEKFCGKPNTKPRSERPAL
ncbi:hypothetical protein P7L53_00420 [Thermoleptolyngbya sichuanensis XZ-Cy5]|uniref:hypothetical protein n=1 Tax=Thermoleptolyngbya sichuanensis TaxID=2885951 RepID=UPI00240DC963|nr:hypothetical protein [Thermoleptolyngbya sichuanensis]MDG2614695.1 hypothetical protein [Thermoleptolyngbya sichuanensis XZ-Cy5]